MMQMLKISLVPALLGSAFIAMGTMLPMTVKAQQETAFVKVEKSRNLPVRGQSRNSVRNHYGEPMESVGAVGKPPISSWQYPEFIVYFEYDLVITSVAKSDHLPSRLDNIQ